MGACGLQEFSGLLTPGKHFQIEGAEGQVAGSPIVMLSSYALHSWKRGARRMLESGRRCQRHIRFSCAETRLLGHYRGGVEFRAGHGRAGPAEANLFAAP